MLAAEAEQQAKILIGDTPKLNPLSARGTPNTWATRPGGSNKTNAFVLFVFSTGCGKLRRRDFTNLGTSGTFLRRVKKTYRISPKKVASNPNLFFFQRGQSKGNFSKDGQNARNAFW